MSQEDPKMSPHQILVLKQGELLAQAQEHAARYPGEPKPAEAVKIHTDAYARLLRPGDRP